MELEEQMILGLVVVMGSVEEGGISSEMWAVSVIYV